MKWVEKSLDELGTVSRGRSRHRPRDAAHLYGGPFPFIQTGDVKHAGLYLRDYQQTYSDAGLAQSKLWPAGTLCITIAANIADTAILAMDACFPDSVIGFSADEGQADARFIKYLFDALLKSKYRTFSQGVAQDNLSQEKLLSIKLTVPEAVTEQTRIADILAAYDDLIANNERRIALLERTTHLIFNKWFVRLCFPGHEHTSITDRVPDGWKLKTAHDALEILGGGTPKTGIASFWGDGVPFFTPKDVSNCVWVSDTERHITDDGLSNCNSRLYGPQTVFITARGTVGKLNLALVPMAMSQSCYALIGKDGLSQYYVYLAMHNSISALKQQASGAVFDAIIIDTFKRIHMFVPKQEVVDDFTKLITPYFEMISNLYLQSKHLKDGRNLLLPRLMDGRIAV